jgi:hypothetical protein
VRKVYLYVVDRDFGFAPNPFHGVCTLATCKPRIRGVAKPGDWVVGVGGSNLDATGKCIFFMQVTGALTFNDYWAAPEFRCKRPARNGSQVAMLGDNIYHRADEGDEWVQEDSHHSRPNGSPDIWNVSNDTRTDRVLYSEKFIYFGENAPAIPPEILRDLGYTNGRNHRTFDEYQARPLITWFEQQAKGRWSTVQGDPFQFARSAARYSRETNKVT